MEGAHRSAAVFRQDRFRRTGRRRSRPCNSRPPPSPTTAPFPGEFAFAVIDPGDARDAVGQSQSGFRVDATCPPGTRSLALVCHDPDVPSRGDDVNKEGRTVPASLPRVDFFHWALIDLPPSTRGDRARRAFRRRDARAASPGRMRRAKAVTASTTTRAGSPATTTWAATTTATTARARRGTTRSRIATCSRCTRSMCRALPSRTSSPARTSRARDGRPRARAGLGDRALHAQSRGEAVAQPRSHALRRASACGRRRRVEREIAGVVGRGGERDRRSASARRGGTRALRRSRRARSAQASTRSARASLSTRRPRRACRGRDRPARAAGPSRSTALKLLIRRRAARRACIAARRRCRACRRDPWRRSPAAGGASRRSRPASSPSGGSSVPST